MSDELHTPIVNSEPIKNQEIEIKPINQPNFSVNYPAGQGYLGQNNRPPGQQIQMTGGSQQMMGPGGQQMMGPGGQQMMRPPMMGPGSPQMMGPGGQQMMRPPMTGPGGPQMMGTGGRPPMMGSGGQQMMGPGGQQMMGQGGANVNPIVVEDEYKNMNYEKSYPCYEDCMQCCCSCCGTCRQFIPCLCCLEDPNIEIPQSYCGLKMRFGKYVQTVEAGLQFITPHTERVIKVDLQVQTLDLVKQSIITRDNITATIDTAISYKIINPRYVIFRLDNYVASVENLTYSALRTVCGAYTLDEIQQKKGEITAQLQLYISERVKRWGMIIQQIFIKDIVLNQNLQQTLSSATKMQRTAESRVISAKADVESAKLMREAADSLSSEAAMQIRYFETISHLATDQSHKVVFIPFVQDQEF